MTTHLPKEESAALHPTVQAMIEAMQTARRQELAELKGSALGFAQCQLESGSEGEEYQASVVARVNEAFDNRERYLDNAPLALIAFIPWLLHLGVAAVLSILSLLEGRWVADITVFQMTIVFLLIMQGIIHFSIGFKGLWHELCRHKWAWLIGLSFTVFCIFVGVKALSTNDWDDGYEKCYDDCSYSKRRIDF
ncbi:hypothetical protein RBE51_21820 [Pseudomonas taiwanensis]|uniref:hypothetical protein n=1 Tax=Pseudomonas taiwanensis TaxID=470150 RepID=UPI0028DE87E4|nr:hypothetical protein [Pseudomonas taiwanensis]MDT8925438.1 hypothetical protein [Pseudomonas taiwanensis]